MIRAALLSLMMVVLTPVLTLAGPILWDRAEQGMTEADIKRLYPDVVPGPMDSLNSGARDRLAIDGYMVEGEPFQVRFFFNTAGLEQVTLTHERPETTSEDTLPKFVRRFTSEMGFDPEVKSAEGLLVIRDFRWRAGRKVITVLWLRVGEHPPIMNLVFQNKP